MRNRLLVLALAALGMLVAGSIGYAAYLASRDSVGLPVTKLQTRPRDLAPTVAQRPRRTTQATTTAPTSPTTTDDHGGSGSGDDHGGSGGGGHGGDD